MRPPTTHPNGSVTVFLAGYFSAAEACEELSWLDDILAGVVWLKTDGDSGTRPLSLKVLFCVLQRCEVISTSGVGAVLAGRARPRTVERYAAAARVASKAIAARLASVKLRPGIREARNAVDAEAMPGAAKAEAASLARPPTNAPPVTFDPLRLADSGAPPYSHEALARALRRERVGRLAHLSDRDRIRRTESFRNLIDRRTHERRHAASFRNLVEGEQRAP